jgi:hypothetical protein
MRVAGVLPKSPFVRLQVGSSRQRRSDRPFADGITRLIVPGSIFFESSDSLRNSVQSVKWGK